MALQCDAANAGRHTSGRHSGGTFGPQNNCTVQVDGGPWWCQVMCRLWHNTTRHQARAVQRIYNLTREIQDVFNATAQDFSEIVWPSVRMHYAQVYYITDTHTCLSITRIRSTNRMLGLHSTHPIRQAKRGRRKSTSNRSIFIDARTLAEPVSLWSAWPSTWLAFIDLYGKTVTE